MDRVDRPPYILKGRVSVFKQTKQLKIKKRILNVVSSTERALSLTVALHNNARPVLRAVHESREPNR